MSPYFTHPLVLFIWSIAIGTSCVFVVLTLSNWSTFRALRTRAAYIYSCFTLLGALQALSVAATFLPMSAVHKAQTFRLMWVFGAASLSFWIWAVAIFAGTTSRSLTFARRAFLTVAGIAATDLLIVAFGGHGFFFVLAGWDNPSLVVRATGNVLRHAPFADAVGLTTAGLALFTSVVLVRQLLAKEHLDRALLVGVIFTPLLFATELGLVLARSAHSAPLVFLANLVEAVRISWASREDLFLELSRVRQQRERQAIVIEGQLAQLRLDQRLANVGQQTAQLSHDLRNPLTAVIAGLDIVELALKRNPIDPKLAGQAMERIRSATGFTLNLVNRITEQARTEEEPASILSLRALIDDSLCLCAHRLQDTEVTVEVSPELSVRGKSTELVQAFVNLITNAAQAVEPLAERWIRISADFLQGHLEVRITDSGPRPSEDVLARMFTQRFSTFSTRNATGLGLTIVNQIVKQHRGRVQVDRGSERTTVVIRLPVVGSDSKPPPSTQPQSGVMSSVS